MTEAQTRAEVKRARRQRLNLINWDRMEAGQRAALASLQRTQKINALIARGWFRRYAQEVVAYQVNREVERGLLD